MDQAIADLKNDGIHPEAMEELAGVAEWVLEGGA